MNTTKYLRILFALFLIGMVTNFSYGQAGIRAGLNMASLKIKLDFFGTSLSESTDRKLGGQIGVYYRTEMTEKFSIRTNLLFSSGGGKVEDPSTMESSSVSASYLMVPVDFMYSAPVGKNSLSLLGGPFVGYLLSSTSSEGSSEEDEFRSIDYGINLGFHFQVDAFGVGLTYGLGLANVIPSEAPTSSFFGDVKANSDIFSLYFTYDL